MIIITGEQIGMTTEVVWCGAAAQVRGELKTIGSSWEIGSIVILMKTLSAIDAEL